MRDTISFSKSFKLKNFFYSQLQKGSTLYDSQEPKVDRFRTKIVNVVIGQKNWEHQGYELTWTAENQFAQFLEEQVKADFIAYAGMMYITDNRLTSIIERYRRINGFTEDDWPTVTMLKICQRANVKSLKNQFREQISSFLDNFFMTYVSNRKTAKTTENNES